MKSVILSSYNKNVIRAMLGLKVEELADPIPDENDVIIKVHAAPVNPSDIAFIQGTYNIVKSLPTVPGFEASGIVIDAGNNTKDYIGKKVSCFVQDDRSGTWSDIITADIADGILLKEEMDMDQAACFTVNPFTAYGMFSIALQYESKAIIQNAAGSQVATFIRKMAYDKGIEVIDIVRKQETANMLINQGAKNVIVETSENFGEELKSITSNLCPTVAYDAVGGSLSGMMFNSLSPDSELVVYGGLSGKSISGVDVMDVIFDNKVISGFNLMDWKAELNEDEFLRISNELQDGTISGLYHTNIRGYSSLQDIAKGLRSYITDMSGGKLLIKP